MSKLWGVLWMAALCTAAGWAAEPAPIRVGAVALRDHAGRNIGFSALDGRMVSLLKKAGFQAVTLRYQPAADLDNAARQAKCAYVLYTDIVDIRKTDGCGARCGRGAGGQEREEKRYVGGGSRIQVVCN